jgi:hypothetical protein
MGWKIEGMDKKGPHCSLVFNDMERYGNMFVTVPIE